MRKVRTRDLRTLEVDTVKAAQGTKHEFWPIIVKGGQSFDGLHFPEDERVETSAKAIKFDGPTFIAMQEMSQWFSKKRNLDESTVMRLGFCYFAAKMGIDHPAVLEQAERFENLWMG